MIEGVTVNFPWHMNLVALLGCCILGMAIGHRAANGIAGRLPRARAIITVCRLGAILLLPVGIYMTLIAFRTMSQMTLFWSLVGSIPGIGLGILFSLPGKPLRRGREPLASTSPITPESLQVPLDRLRQIEWQWLDPCAPVPATLLWHRVFDRLTFGAFSRKQLAKKDQYGLGHVDVHRFAWECAAISIRPSLAEAYALRALDGNVIYATMGAVDRLKGWDRKGNESTYDRDRALVDTAIALHYFPEFPWALYVQGYISWMKARFDSPGGKIDTIWRDHAKRCLELSLRQSHEPGVHQNIENCRKLLCEIG